MDERRDPGLRSTRVDTGTLIPELRRRGVPGAIGAYVVVAAGALQLGDVVMHALELPPWTLKALLVLATAGLPLTIFVSWFYDLTGSGFVRTVQPTPRSPAPSPIELPPAAPTAPSPAPLVRAPLDAHALGPGSPPLAGRYRIEEELGAGGMGRVLAATDEKLGRRVAIKVLTAAHEPGRLKRFAQEARAAGSLEHPNVLAVYDLGEHEGSPFLVTELLDGRTLRDAVAAAPLDPEALQKVALQLARGLGAAHARGVVHRDLKPENLMVTRDGRVKILDFGLAKLVSDEPPAPGQGLTVTGAIFGTPGYLSPEQARGLPADARSDVFAAGAVLYEAATGRRAFPGTTLVEAGHAALTQEPPPFPKGVPPRFQAVVLRCLEKDPARRFADGNALAEALELAPLGGGALPSPRGTRYGAVVATIATAIGGTFLGVGLGAKAIRARADRRAAAQVRVGLPQQQPRWPVGRPSELPGVPAPPAMPAMPAIPAVPAPPAPPEPPDAERSVEQEVARSAAEAKRLALEQFAKLRDLKDQVRAAARVGGGRVAFLQTVNELVAAGQFTEAERLARSAIEEDEEDPYPRLHLFLLQRRGHRYAEAQAELRLFADEQEGAEWIAPVARYYAGLIDEAKVFGLAGKPREARARQSRLCEANYYVGMFHATAQKPDLAKARMFLARAVETKAPDVEAQFAAQELARLASK